MHDDLGLGVALYLARDGPAGEDDDLCDPRVGEAGLDDAPAGGARGACDDDLHFRLVLTRL